MKNLGNLLPRILGFLIIIITLALAPSINTANTTIQAANLTNLTGMSAVDDFGAPLIILGLLVSGGLLTLASVRNRLEGAGIKDMLGVIGAVVVAIVGLTMFDSIIDYTNDLIDASTGFAVTIYGIIPIIIYIGIVGASGFSAYSSYRSYRGKTKKSKKTAPAVNY